MSKCTTLPSPAIAATTIDDTSAPSDGQSYATRLSGWAVRTLEQLAKARRHRLAEQHQFSMADRMLKDIGIARAQIAQAVRFGREETD